mgnify:CR=1 FL=1
MASMHVAHQRHGDRLRALAAACAVRAGAAVVSGCSSSTIDHIPTAVGGLPEGFRSGRRRRTSYPAVHDMPPGARTDESSSEAEKKLAARRSGRRTRENAARDADRRQSAPDPTDATLAPPATRDKKPAPGAG